MRTGLFWTIVIIFSTPCATQEYIRKGENLTNVPSGIPNNTTHINLKYNRIQQVTASDLVGLENLRSLALSFNKLHTFPALDHEAAQNLQVLYLTRNDIENVTAEELQPLDELLELHLGHNKLTEFVTSEASPVLPKLVILTLTANEITIINAETFKGCNSLHSLNLDKNFLTAFPDFSYIGATLTVLNMEHNQISNISQETIAHLSVIATLNLAYNQLATFPNITVIASTLKYIDFRYNPMSGPLDVALLEEFVYMNSWPLNNMGLSEVPLFDTLCRNFESLDMSHNLFTDVNPEAIEFCDSLTSLDLDSNPIAFFPNLTYVGDNLTHLSMQNTQLNATPPELLEYLLVIEDLDLQGNNFTSFPNLSSIGNTLIYLSLENNQISEVNFIILSEMTVLKTLNLNDNDLPQFPDVASVPLEELYLCNNHLTVFPSLLSIGITLKQLRLSGNPIIQVDTADFELLQAITTLQMDPILGELPDIRAICDTLTHLEISHGENLQSIHHETTHYLGSITNVVLQKAQMHILRPTCPQPGHTLDLQYSQIDLCHCEMLWLKRIEVDTPETIHITNVECSDFGRKWSEISLGEFLEACAPAAVGCTRGMTVRSPPVLSVMDEFFCPAPLGAYHPDLNLQQCMGLCLTSTGCTSFNFRHQNNSAYSGMASAGDCVLVSPSLENTAIPPGAGTWMYYSSQSVESTCP